MDSNIKEAREIIAQTDRELAALFEKRMDASKTVAEYKKKYGLPIENREQEAAVIERNKDYIKNKELTDYFVSLTECLMELSKKYQYRLNEGTSIAYNGSEGAFAHIAANKIFPGSVLTSYSSFEDAYDAVKNGECDLAVLPVENSYAGEVGSVIDLMYSGPLNVNGVWSLPISHNLMGVENCEINKIKTVISHPQALAQCEKYIKRHGWNTLTAESTTAAAEYAAKSKDGSVAAVASLESARINSLKVIEKNINASRDNTTKFAVFSKSFCPESACAKDGKFILMFTVNDEAGALAKVLNVISENGFNMHVLRSRSVRDKAWQYYFYAEIEGDDNSENGRKMLSELGGRCETLKIIGHYSEGGVTDDN